MIHLISGKLKEHGNEFYIENDFFGIEVEYAWTKKKWQWYLYPIIDPNRHTIKYYAFDNHKQKVRFLEICKIQGIWWKSWYIIACLDDKKVKQAIEDFDIKFFTSLPWVWPKTAKRLLVELKTTLEDSDVKKLSINDKLLKNILTSLHELWYERSNIKKQLTLCPVDLTKDNLPEIMKRLVENL